MHSLLLIVLVVVLIIAIFFIINFSFSKNSSKKENNSKNYTLLLGRRGTAEHIRGVDVDGRTISAPYMDVIKWELDPNDKNYIYVDHTIRVPLSKTKVTTYKCYPTDSNNPNLNREEFLEYLSKLVNE